MHMKIPASRAAHQPLEDVIYRVFLFISTEFLEKGGGRYVDAELGQTLDGRITIPVRWLINQNLFTNFLMNGLGAMFQLQF